ncbi:MAG: iron-containing alcohol dehydrogenase [Spirochaetota bacterium]
MPVLTDWVSFQFPPKVHIEVDCSHKVGNFIRQIGNRTVIISTQEEMKNDVEFDVIKSSIENNTDGVILYDDIENFTTLKSIDTATHFVKQAQANCIVAYGSYDSINAAKAVSALATNDLFAEQMIIEGKALKNPPLPLVVIPTMPLIGMECSPFCTVVDNKDKKRKYFAHLNLFPELIIADAKISMHMTSIEVAKIGTAILAASVDTILSKYSNEITSASSLRAIELISKNLITSYRDPKNLNAKNMLYAASLLTGIAQSVSSLGLTFALSLAATSLTKLDIYQSMSILLTHVMDYNLTSSAQKYVMIARALDEDVTDISVIEAAIKAVDHIRSMYREIKVPSKLSEFEVKKIGLPAIASLASTYPFLESQNRELPKNEIETILLAAF